LQYGWQQQVKLTLREVKSPPRDEIKPMREEYTLQGGVIIGPLVVDDNIDE